MPKIYRISKSGLRLFYKIRHHRGHGIHSPFVYNLISKVIEEKTPYYAYKEIEDYLVAYPWLKEKISKYNLLCFRLVNYFHSKNILEIGSGYGINTLFLTSPSSDIKCKCVELSVKNYTVSKEIYKNWNRNIIVYNKGLPAMDDAKDLISVNLRNYDRNWEELFHYLLNLSADKTVIIMKGIRTNKRHHLLWKCLMSHDKVTVSLDLFNSGILFFDPKLYKKNYKISF